MASNSDRSQEKVPRDKNADSHRRGHKIKRDDGTRSFDLPAQRTVNVRMRFGGRIQVFDCGDLELDIGDWVVIKDFDVLRMGLVATRPLIWPANQESRKVLLPSERRLIRLATQEDLAKQAENQLKEREGLEYCQFCIDNQKLLMKLVAVEVTFDNFKTIFYYTADDRVDFRQLVKELVSRFRTRIEMRQIGVRQEALMLGGVGVCGRPFCCSGFLSNFSPVSVKMAKEQHLSLNTVKISGVCGRLMCCLAFENYTVQVPASGGDEDGPPLGDDGPPMGDDGPDRWPGEAPKVEIDLEGMHPADAPDPGDGPDD
ncbi:MAG: stage 0 sporulation protein [Deltaproteobacteria bacterium]|jgi:cell fate regulator YaaT (PSP1 superfamily)|nr:stage 0 sporulation protein [Deltaproteobacteria bacterium]